MALKTLNLLTVLCHVMKLTLSKIPLQNLKSLTIRFWLASFRLFTRLVLALYQILNLKKSKKMEKVCFEEVSLSSDVIKKEKVAKSLADWLEIDFSIKIFGQTILQWHYPPRKK